MHRVWTVGLVSMMAVWAMLPGNALAQGPAYVGKWAVKLADCRLGQEAQGAPLVIGKRRYDQHEAHCQFTSVRPKDGQWHVQANCSVEGDKQKHTFTLSVAGNRLTLREAGCRATVYRRCA